MAEPMTSLKMEGDVAIKADPDREMSAPVVDDFDYEDTGELEIPKERTRAWLVRLPKQLHENWAHLANDQPIQIGHVRRFTKSDKWELHLNPSISQSQGLSKRYDMRTTGQNVQNTFTFSEKDLPGFKSKSKMKSTSGNDQGGRLGTNQGRVDKNGRYQGFSRRAIPKQTALAAAIDKEVTCIPLDVETEPRQQRLDVEQGKGRMTMLQGDVRKFAGIFIQPEVGKASKARSGFDSFNIEGKTTKAKAQENKNARMPLSDLLDALGVCFTKYRYWSMTALRQELHQPESWLRESLPLIADQVKSGPFNNHWKLKPESEPQHLEMATKEESAPQAEGDGDGDGDEVSSAVESGIGEDDDDDDNDDDLQMEDVGL